MPSPHGLERVLSAGASLPVGVVGSLAGRRPPCNNLAWQCRTSASGVATRSPTLTSARRSVGSTGSSHPRPIASVNLSRTTTTPLTLYLGGELVDVLGAVARLGLPAAEVGTTGIALPPSVAHRLGGLEAPSLERPFCSAPRAHIGPTVED